MKFKNAAGAKIVEALTSGIYDGNSNCIREYVQNSVDSHSELIEIDHTNNGSDIKIRDYGAGMDSGELKNALKLGYSKKGPTEVGWRGIGIYSGVPNFRKIHINTKKKGSETKLHITILCDKIREGYLQGLSLDQILEKGVPGEIEKIRDRRFKEGTEVLLNQVEVGQKPFFEEETLKKELIKVLPLPMKDNQFKNEIVRHLATEGIVESSFEIKFNGDKLFRPPFDSELFDPESIVMGTKSAGDGTKLFTFWVLTSKKNKELFEPHTGIVFKKKQFTIGNRDTFRRLVVGTYNQWNYGEIHILDERILENAARNFFEINSGHTNELMNTVGEFITQLQRNNRKKSSKDKKTEIEKINKDVEGGANLRQALVKVDKIRSSVSRQVTGATTEDLSTYSQKLDQRGTLNIALLDRLENKIATMRTDTAEQEYQKVLTSLSPRAKKMTLAKVNDITANVNFTHSMDKIEQKIRSKVASQKSEFLELLKDVFIINGGAELGRVRANCKLFIIDPSRIASNTSKPTTKNYSYYLTTEFAHLLNSLYQLLVNGEKHHNEIISKVLLEGKSRAEIAAFYNDLDHAITFCEKMLDISKKRSEVGGLP